MIACDGKMSLGGSNMPDLLIRGVSQEAIDAATIGAKRLGISRNELLRRDLEAQRHRAQRPKLTREDLRRAAAACADLANPEIMAEAWR